MGYDYELIYKMGQNRMRQMQTREEQDEFFKLEIGST